VPNMKVFEQRGKSVGNVPLIPTYGCFTGKAENRCGCCRFGSKTHSVVPNMKVFEQRGRSVGNVPLIPT